MGIRTIAFRSPVRVPLLRYGTPKPLPPDPRAYETFRVTQTFDHPDPMNPGQLHRAVDIGNFRCGDTLVAMAPGDLSRIHDNAKAARGAPTDALGVRIDHGSGVTSELWHLSQWLAEHGSTVNAGQPVGSVGNTGLGGVCHCHVEIKINGVRIDPEPFMFGQSLTIGDEDSVERFGGSELKALPGATQFRLTVGANFREGRTRDSRSIKVFDAGTVIYPSNSIDGEAVGTNDQWSPCYMYTGSAYEYGYFHTSVFEAIESDDVNDVQGRIDGAIPNLRSAVSGLQTAIRELTE